jgi:hypothetical protein
MVGRKMAAGYAAQPCSATATSAIAFVNVYVLGFGQMYLRSHHLLKFIPSFYPYPTKWGWYKMFSACCDKDTTIIFTTSRLLDVNPP